MHDINPLDWHNTKYLSYIPPHFVKIVVDSGKVEVPELLLWIEKNVGGRFGIESELTTNDSQQTSYSFVYARNKNIKIGFEDPAEATMFSLIFN
jgi:hypothetical protein